MCIHHQARCDIKHSNQKIWKPLLVQDVLFPYCIDDRHTPDTLFVLAESDWRMYKEDMLGSAVEIAQHISQDVRDAMTAFRTARAEANESGDVPDSARERTTLRNMDVPPPKRSSQLARGSLGAAIRRSAEAHASAMGFREHDSKSDHHSASSSTALDPLGLAHDKFDDNCEVGSEPSQAPANTERSFAGWSRNFPAMHISQELEDLVCLMTRAHRAGQRCNGKGAGEFVWLSYNARNSRGRRESPSFGSHLFAFTRNFAIEFLNHMWSIKPYHADLVLRAWLKENAEREWAQVIFFLLAVHARPMKVGARKDWVCAKPHLVQNGLAMVSVARVVIGTFDNGGTKKHRHI